MARVPWPDLPAAVREWAEATLGSPVLTAVTQPGGFSPGAACRLRLADGGRAFLKAVSASANPVSPGLHRREARVAATLPPGLPVPEFLGCYDDGEWVALLFADAGGAPPAQPWRDEELGTVLAALDRLHESLTPPPDGLAVATMADQYRDDLCGWRTLAAGDQSHGCADARSGPDDLGRFGEPGEWCGRSLGWLASLEARWEQAAAGNTLLHADMRADNILVTGDSVVFVDWPSACVGAAWFDVVAFAPSVAMQGGPDPEQVLGRARSATKADPDAVTAVVAAVAGYFVHQSRLPPPPGLPTLREFQAAQAVPAISWLRQRTGWR